MGRSGYTEDYEDDNLVVGRWRGMVESAIRGRRGQKFLRDVLAALDAMPDKRLIAEKLQDDEGNVCTVGVGMLARGVPNVHEIDPADHDRIGQLLDIAPCLVQELEYLNDEECHRADDEQRWHLMRQYIERMASRPAAGGA